MPFFKKKYLESGGLQELLEKRIWGERGEGFPGQKDFTVFTIDRFVYPFRKEIYSFSIWTGIGISRRLFCCVFFFAYSYDNLPPSLFSGPLSELSDGKEARERHIRNLVQAKGVRSAVAHRQNGWRKYRRPRPRLSHKGPMPF